MPKENAPSQDQYGDLTGKLINFCSSNPLPDEEGIKFIGRRPTVEEIKEQVTGWIDSCDPEKNAEYWNEYSQGIFTSFKVAVEKGEWMHAYACLASVAMMVDFDRAFNDPKE